MAKATNNIVIPSNPSDLASIKSAVKEISDCMLRKESEQEQIKEILNMLVEKYELPKSFLSKMAKVYHKSLYDKEVSDHNDFAALYETVMK